MTGFDSESDRREAIRKQVVDDCAAYVNRRIIEHSITHTPNEQSYLLATVIERLCKSLYLDMRLLMMREEAATAMQEIEKE